MMRSGKNIEQLGLLARGLSSSSILSSVPAVAPAGGIFSLFGSSKRVSTPLDVPLNNVQLITPVSVPATAPPTEKGILSNGVRVAAEELMGPYVSLGIFINSGSVNETPATSGASHLMEQMAFKGTQNRSHFATVRAAEAHGVMLSANVSREQTVFYAMAPRNSLAAAMELLCDTVVNPKYVDHTLSEQMEAVRELSKQNISDPKFHLMEGIVSAAYTGALARPLYYDGSSNINAELLTQFHHETVSADKVVLVTAGAPLNVAQSLGNDYLGGLVPSANTVAPISKYMGGGDVGACSAGAHVVIAFEVAGWNDVKGSVMATVMQYLLGGGQDFSSGGPGKGMHSRLYQNVLTSHNWVSSCSSYGNLFDNTGLLGIYASTPDSSRSAEIVDIVCHELESVAHTITPAELERAKRQARSTVHQALEVPQVVCEDIGRQILTLGERVHLSKFIEEINAITTDDAKKYFKGILATKPCASMLGDLAIMPKFDHVKSRFG